MDTTLAAGVRSAQAVLRRCRAIAPARLLEALARGRRGRRQASTCRILAGLDDTTLRDIGRPRAEIESVAAEAHEAVVASRVRTRWSAAAEGRS